MSATKATRAAGISAFAARSVAAIALWGAIAPVLFLAAGCPRPVARITPANLSMEPRHFTYDHGGMVFRLANGMTVLLLPDDKTNLVKVDMRYRVGAAQDPAGKSGLAHLVEHATYQLETDGAITIAGRLGNLAIYHNAYTTWEETHYTAVALKEYAAVLLALEAQRMQGACEQIDRVVLAREREIVRNEIRQRAGVAAELRTEVHRAIYGRDHAYARPVGGTDRELASIARDDVCRFIRDYYSPSRAILVLSGSLSPARDRDLVRQIFGPIAARQATPLVAAMGPGPYTPPANLVGGHSRYKLAVKEATAIIALPAHPFTDRQSHYDRMFAELLGGELETLRQGGDFITAVTVGHLGGVRVPVLAAAISVADPGALAGVESMFFRTCLAVTRDIDLRQFAVLRERRRSSLLRSVEPFMRRATIFADYLQYSPTSDLIIDDLVLVNELSLHALWTHAQNLCQRERSHVVFVYPDPGARPEEQRAAPSFSDKDYELEDWQWPADPQAANRPLALPTQRVRIGIRDFTLRNGLRVLLAPDLDYPVVDIRVLLPGGSLHEPPDKPGLSQLAAHMLEPDRSRPFRARDRQAIQLVLQMGGEVSMYTDELTATFRMTGLSMYVDGLLWQLHWLLETGVYDGAKLETLRERYARVKSAQDGATRDSSRLLRELLFGPGHPYAAPGITPESLGRLSVGDLARFRDLHYRARGATVIVAGRFDAGRVESEIIRLFGQWPDLSAPRPRQVPAAWRPGRSVHLAMADEDTVQTRILIAFAVESPLRSARARSMVLREMVRLKLAALRDRLGASYGVSVRYIYRQGPGQLVISAAVDRERSGEAFVAIRQALRELRTGQFLAEFARARRKVVQRVLASSLDSESVADELEIMAEYRLSRTHYGHLATQVADLRPDDMRAFIAGELAQKRQVVLSHGRRASLEAMYRAAGVSEVRPVE